MNTTLAEIITTGMNNPECSFYVGTFFSQIITLKLIIVIFIVAIFFKMLDKLAVTPIIEWIKNKVKKNKERNKK